MNVKVITRHFPSNYGSLLQSLATVKVLNQLGCDAAVIDYVRSDDCGLRKVWTEAQLKGGNLLKKVVYALIRYPIEKLAEVRFSSMRRRYLKMTFRVHSQTQLSSLQADVFITGSDQVWGPMVNGRADPAYFLSFVNNGRKVSYAASFGRTNFDVNTEQAYQKALLQYDKITVREDSAVKLLAKWGCQNCIGQVLDPTLLLSSEEWKNIFRIKKIKVEPYLLVYQIHNDPKFSAYAKSLADKKGLKLVRVNPFLHQCLRRGKFICCPDVSDFFRLIDGASCMVTDSFHGTCFAINLNKQFVEILPNNATGTRNQSVLLLTGLSSRIVTDFSAFSLMDEEINYMAVNEILDKERVRCKAMMKNLLS